MSSGGLGEWFLSDFLRNLMISVAFAYIFERIATISLYFPVDFWWPIDVSFDLPLDFYRFFVVFVWILA